MLTRADSEPSPTADACFTLRPVTVEGLAAVCPLVSRGHVGDLKHSSRGKVIPAESKANEALKV